MNPTRRLCIQALAAGGAGVSASPALAQGEPVAGRDFRAVNPVQAVEAPAGRVEVLEFLLTGARIAPRLRPSLMTGVSASPRKSCSVGSM